MDTKWVKAGVVFTALCFICSAWSVYRIEYPKSPVQAQSAAEHRESPMSGPSLWLVVPPMVASSGMLLIAVWIAFMRRLPSSGRPDTLIPSPALHAKITNAAAPSPLELRAKIATLAGSLVAVLIENEYEIERIEDYGGADIKTIFEEPPPIDSALQHALDKAGYRTIIADIKPDLGYYDLLNDVPPDSARSIRDLIELEVRVPGDLQDVIRGLRETAVVINRKFGLLPVARRPLNLSAQAQERQRFRFRIAELESELAVANKQLSTWPAFQNKLEAAQRIVQTKTDLLAGITENRGDLVVSVILLQYAEEARSLLTLLKEVWDLYNNDRQQNEGALIYPLAVASIPDIISEWRHKELWRFRTLYRAHIDSLKKIDPNCHTNTIDMGFPRNDNYNEIAGDLWNHSALLAERARVLRATLRSALISHASDSFSSQT